MRFSTSLLLPLFTAFAVASPLSPRVITAHHGTISQPTKGFVAASGAAVPFSYGDSNWCQGGYTPITVWLLDSEPTTTNLNATGQFPDATYYFGSYLMGNFGLPPIGNPVPPATLTMPDVSGFVTGSELYLAVVETANNCPPGNTPAQYGMTSAMIVTA
ncbi:hypothetical protein C8R43DRAFT_989059 [Mycena crocata]|nr:hypothetical protein C8R43DRAFT_989059 [Mycena crocata]